VGDGDECVVAGTGNDLPVKGGGKCVYGFSYDVQCNAIMSS
jgi:hypothetical protein